MRIGIITIHKLINFGTALQAFALQKYLQRTICNETEIIDYVFPNTFHKGKKTIIKIIRGWGRVLLDYLFEKKYRYNKRFRYFQNKYFDLSENIYSNIQSINANPPLYDIYITGSDQVWNTETVKNDPSFYLCFAPKDKPKIAFSACFANDSLNDKYKYSVRERLSNYKYIGIREKSALRIIRDLNIPQNIVVCNTCDPTLLLSKDDYSEIASESKMDIKENYILVYIMMYAFNPYPALESILEQIQRETGLPIVVIGDSKFRYKGKYKFIKGIGPIDFLWLFEHASYVITSSFHGTMFSLIFRKPFTAISPNTGDCRIKDVLEDIGLTRNLIFNNNENPELEITSPYTNQVEDKLEKFINTSKDFLKTAIMNSQKQ